MKEQGRKKVSFFRGKVHFYQDSRHRISVDLVLFLSRVRGIKRSSRVIDLGAGFGFLSIVTAIRHRCRVCALERDEGMLDMLKENITLNSAEELVEVVEGDVREADRIFHRDSFDVCLCNPPFFEEAGEGIHRSGDTTLGDFISAGSYLLRDGGYFNLMIPSFRLAEAFEILTKHHLPPRFLTAVFPTPEKECRICFVTSIRNVPGPLHFDRPLVINNVDGGYTQEVSRLLEGYLS